MLLLNVPLSQSGKSLTRNRITATVMGLRCTIRAQYSVTSNVTVNVFIDAHNPTTGWSASGDVTGTISSGSTSTSVSTTPIFGSHSISVTDKVTCTINTISPQSDSTYDYTT